MEPIPSQSRADRNPEIARYLRGVVEGLVQSSYFEQTVDDLFHRRSVGSDCGVVYFGSNRQEFPDDPTLPPVTDDEVMLICEHEVPSVIVIGIDEFRACVHSCVDDRVRAGAISPRLGEQAHARLAIGLAGPWTEPGQGVAPRA